MLIRVSLKSWYLIHKWTSLICTLFMLLLCLTGLPLIFAEEIDQALGRSVELPQLMETGPRADLDAIVADALTRKPGHVAQFLVGDAEEPDLWSVRLGKSVAAPEASAFYSYDARNGEFVLDYPLDEGFMNIILRLHVDLFAGLPGMLFLGAMGVLLILALVSGTVLYGYYMRKLQFGTVRRERSPQMKWLDLHNLLGIVTLVWLFTVGLTGVVNTLAEPIFGRWQATELADMLAPYRKQAPLSGTSSVQNAWAAAQQTAPNMSLSFMAFPGNDFAGPNQFVAFMQGNTPLTSKLLLPIVIDAPSGQVIATRELPVYVSVLLLSKPLHFGNYGGLPLKILWALLDGISIVVLVSGLYLWLKKRKLSFEARLGLLRTQSVNKFPLEQADSR
ncbi:MAG: PepSY domain-containing protein [Methylococcaceae bacterium]|nr:PepSY domain-containing protein [Methylococcaceae bacterium]MDZ4156455.1 PepSY domain-containing protein [Methylococcales bacterium]MDP2391671.1 PepSY domain-containing protein [Methylococcaceae bacterium]MDP3018170.1 PepSY domain-containing protein [Methylococcaceae bacterium]MDP3389383.1 PepSY domain-containing protein [Methylococcaceae bacterium]